MDTWIKSVSQNTFCHLTYRSKNPSLHYKEDHQDQCRIGPRPGRIVRVTLNYPNDTKELMTWWRCNWRVACDNVMTPFFSIYKRSDRKCTQKYPNSKNSSYQYIWCCSCFTKKYGWLVASSKAEAVGQLMVSMSVVNYLAAEYLHLSKDVEITIQASCDAIATQASGSRYIICIRTLHSIFFHTTRQPLVPTDTINIQIWFL